MSSQAIIELENVSIHHENVPVLGDVNLRVERGEFVYLIGKSGAGKTSLCRSLYADMPLHGDVANVCDFSLLNVKRKNIPKLRRKIGIVFQNFQLLTDRNVYNNLYFVLSATGWRGKKGIDEQIIKTLDAVSLLDKINKPIYKLSEGEQQRVGIARALVNEPELIIADEPTGNLDPITSEGIMRLLKSINEEKQTTLLIASHDYIMLDKFPSRMICCENSTLIDL